MAMCTNLMKLRNILGTCSRQGNRLSLAYCLDQKICSSYNLQHNVSSIGYRHLYSLAWLGVDSYGEKREYVSNQMKNFEDRFFQRMHEVLQPESQKMIFTEDLKNAIHLAESTDKDMSLVIGMAKKFHSQQSGVRFGAYVFGPVVMRMFHFLNQPDYMLKALKSDELEGFFDQLKSYNVALDLLYKHGKYQDVTDIFEELEMKRIGGFRYPKSCLTLSIAACYKINTLESYQRMLNTFEGALEAGTELGVRMIAFASALALKQGFPHVSLEILSRVTSLQTEIINLKILSLTELGRADDAFPILRSLLIVDLPDRSLKGQNQQIFKRTIEKVEEAINQLGNKELIAECVDIVKGLERNNLLSEKILDEFISREFTYSPEKSSKSYDKRDRAMMAASFYRNTRVQRLRRQHKNFRGIMDPEF